MACPHGNPNPSTCVKCKAANIRQPISGRQPLGRAIPTASGNQPPIPHGNLPTPPHGRPPLPASRQVQIPQGVQIPQVPQVSQVTNALSPRSAPPARHQPPPPPSTIVSAPVPVKTGPTHIAAFEADVKSRTNTFTKSRSSLLGLFNHLEVTKGDPK